MKKPILVVMAAGMGSRYGGLKQMDPVGSHGEVIMDYSLYDARRAGFEKVIFIIKHSIEDAFKEAIGDHVSKYMEVAYAYQDLDDLPEGYSVPEGREKPWGTCHAILAARDLIDAPFAVINADDYYGYHAFSVIYNFLTTHEDTEKYSYTMVGYRLKNTVTDNGDVSRGICTVNQEGKLVQIVERTQIEKRKTGIVFTEDKGQTWEELDGETLVSMNMWGFTESILQEIKKGFPAFLEKGLQENPMKCEYFLPSVVSELIESEKAIVTVLESEDKWYGVTYREDKPLVMNAIEKLKDEGIYPQHLWKD